MNVMLTYRALSQGVSQVKSPEHKVHTDEKDELPVPITGKRRAYEDCQPKSKQDHANEPPKNSDGSLLTKPPDPRHLRTSHLD